MHLVSKLPAGHTRELVIRGDDTTPASEVRIVDHDGYIYIESKGFHRGEVVYNLVRVSRDRFVVGALGWLL